MVRRDKFARHFEVPTRTICSRNGLRAVQTEAQPDFGETSATRNRGRGRKSTLNRTACWCFMASRPPLCLLVVQHVPGTISVEFEGMYRPETREENKIKHAIRKTKTSLFRAHVGPAASPIVVVVIYHSLNLYIGVPSVNAAHWSL